MRLDKPRITPLREDELTEEQHKQLGPFGLKGPVLNIFKTLVRAPEANKQFLRYGGYILSDANTLKAREREIVILRVGFLCKSGYEWAQHEIIGKQSGLADDEIARIKQGADAKGWSAADAALIRATDDLVTNHFISDESWAGLTDLTDRQKIDLIFTAGQYTQVSMLLNSLGVQLDEGLTLDPDLRG